MSSMQFSLSRVKKSHSPARKIVFEDFPKSTKFLSLTRLKSRKSLNLIKKVNQSPCTNTSDKSGSSCQVFKPKMIREAFLFEPTDYNKMLQSRSKLLHKSTDTPSTPNKIINLLSQYANSNWKKIDYFKTPTSSEQNYKKYFRCIKDNNPSDLVKLLKASPQLVMECDSLGMNGLHWAAKRNYPALAAILAEYRINIYAKDFLGRTAPDLAIKYKNFEFLECFSEISTRIELNRKNNSTLYSHINPPPL